MTMTSLFREVLLPSAAAVGLLFVASADVATAREAPGVEPVQIAAAPVPAARHQPVPMQPTAEADPSRPRNKPLEVERRCDRIQRIGKFTVTRCD
jgi:uncharacterized protein involved in high-affinity Fe2+ transport